MRNISFIFLAIVLSGCSIFPREFEITEIKSEVEDDRLAIHFYTQENLTELSKSRLIQFRCEVNQTEDTIHGEVYMDDEIFHFSNPEHESLANESGRLKAGVAHYIDGYKYVGMPYKDINDLNKYSSLACFVIGVTKAPIPFPRSNKIEIEINEQEFNKQPQRT